MADAQQYEALKLENQLCFPLYACAREVVKKYKPFLDDIDLTYTQYVTMMVLWEKPSVTSKEIGERLHLDSGTLTPVIKKLAEKGLVTRARSAEDERNLVVALTDAGLALRDRAACIPGQMGQCISLSPEDAGTLYRILYQLLGSIQNSSINQNFIYPSSSSGASTMIVAPAFFSWSLVRKPQVTQAQSMPAFFAVSMSTSVSPTYRQRVKGTFSCRAAASTMSGWGFRRTFGSSPTARLTRPEKYCRTRG